MGKTPATEATAAAAAPTVIKAEPGKPWPNPPHGGRWSRDPVTGDLTLIETASSASEEERRAQREKQRAEAEKAGAAKAAAEAATEKKE